MKKSTAGIFILSATFTILYMTWGYIPIQAQERDECSNKADKYDYRPFDGCYIMRGSYSYWEKVN